MAESPGERSPPPVSPQTLHRAGPPLPPRACDRPNRPTTVLDTADVVLPGPHACANCGAERTGPYCQACGQRHRDERLTIRRLLRDVVTRFLDLESGLLHTAWRLTVAPGTVSRDIVAGRRQRYAGPVTYLIVIATLSVLLFTLIDDAFAVYVQQMLRPALEENGILAGKDPEVVASTFVRWMNQGTIYLSAFIALVFAALGRWMVPGWGSRYNFAESCVFALYSTAHGFLLLLPFNMLVLAGPQFVLLISWIGTVVISVYIAVAVRAFVRPHWITSLMSFLAFAASYLLFSFLAGIVGLAAALLFTA